MMSQKDLAEKKHWDFVYHETSVTIEAGWKPVGYDSLCIEHMLLSEIDRCRPETVLEVGCGNSTWLPYLARVRNLKVLGIDYSEEGCALARKRLIEENVEGKIYCGDLFKLNADDIGQFDFVYSLGVVEHFSDLENITLHLLKFVRPGGVLLTEVPNLYSFQGVVSYIYQPVLLKKHRVLRREHLLSSYKNAGCLETECNYLGLFSLNITAWGMYQRFPSLDRLVLPIMHKLTNMIDSLLISLKKYNGSCAFSPFIYVVGKKHKH